jgi:unspecific monooxygenase
MGSILMNQLPNRVTSPTWWQLIRWIADPIQVQIACQKRYGDTFTLKLRGMGSYVIIGNPQALQEIFSQDARCFDAGRANELARPLIGGNSLMLLDGDRHRRERKLLMPPFHGDRLQTYAQKIGRITQQIASQWLPGRSLVARTAMQQISLEVILQVVFGLSEGERYQQIKPLLIDWSNMTDSPLSSSMLFLRFLQKDWGTWTPWGKMKQRQQQIHNLLQAEIDERRATAGETSTDILSLMMAAQDENGQPMSDEELRDELLTLLLAGHETTAIMLAWALYEIHQQPKILEKLRWEIAQLGEAPDPMTVAQLPYLNAVCQETLRKYPVIPVLFPRITKSAITIGGHPYEAETILMPSIYLVHYREDLYPEPHQFKPERFFERQYTPAEYLPFGGGNRRCLGYALAQLEMKLVLATVISQVQLALEEKQPVKLQRRGFTLAPAGGIRMGVINNSFITAKEKMPL